MATWQHRSGDEFDDGWSSSFSSSFTKEQNLWQRRRRYHIESLTSSDGEGDTNHPQSFQNRPNCSKMANRRAAHLFKPLLPGFDSEVPIPLAFYSKHVAGKPNEHTWQLKTDASEGIWEVKQVGKRLRVGWKEFTIAHDLRVGDILIFKHEGDMVFHITLFGPSECDLQYTHADDDDDKIRKRAMSSMSFDYCFLTEVTADDLSNDKLYLPVEAASSNALNKQCEEMIVVNKKGDALRFRKSEGMYYIKRGWRKFCDDNRCEIGDLFIFNLVGDGKTSPLMCVCPERKECSELLSQHLRRKGHIASSSTSSSSRPTGRTA